MSHCYYRSKGFLNSRKNKLYSLVYQEQSACFKKIACIFHNIRDLDVARIQSLESDQKGTRTTLFPALECSTAYRKKRSPPRRTRPSIRESGQCKTGEAIGNELKGCGPRRPR